MNGSFAFDVNDTRGPFVFGIRFGETGRWRDIPAGNSAVDHQRFRVGELSRDRQPSPGPAAHSADDFRRFPKRVIVVRLGPVLFCLGDAEPILVGNNRHILAVRRFDVNGRDNPGRAAQALPFNRYDILSLVEMFLDAETFNAAPLLGSIAQLTGNLLSVDKELVTVVRGESNGRFNRLRLQVDFAAEEAGRPGAGARFRGPDPVRPGQVRGFTDCL